MIITYANLKEAIVYDNTMIHNEMIRSADNKKLQDYKISTIITPINKPFDISETKDSLYIQNYTLSVKIQWMKDEIY